MRPQCLFPPEPTARWAGHSAVLSAPSRVTFLSTPRFPGTSLPDSSREHYSDWFSGHLEEDKMYFSAEFGLPGGNSVSKGQEEKGQVGKRNEEPKVDLQRGSSENPCGRWRAEIISNSNVCCLIKDDHVASKESLVCVLSPHLVNFILYAYVLFDFFVMWDYDKQLVSCAG